MNASQPYWILSFTFSAKFERNLFMLSQYMSMDLWDWHTVIVWRSVSPIYIVPNHETNWLVLSCIRAQCPLVQVGIRWELSFRTNEVHTRSDNAWLTFNCLHQARATTSVTLLTKWQNTVLHFEHSRLHSVYSKIPDGQTTFRYLSAERL